MRRAVFLDRDGTMNRKPPDGHYITTPEEFEFLPGSIEAIRRLNQAGFLVFVVTNQRGIAKGVLTETQLKEIHEKMQRELAACGAHVDGIYYCVHDEGSCHCRKPGIGLHLAAIRDHPEIDLGSSFCIGDSWRDVEASARLGTSAVLIDGVERGSRVVQNYPGTIRVRSLLEAVGLILGNQD